MDFESEIQILPVKSTTSFSCFEKNTFNFTLGNWLFSAALLYAFYVFKNREVQNKNTAFQNPIYKNHSFKILVEKHIPYVAILTVNRKVFKIMSRNLIIRIYEK